MIIVSYHQEAPPRTRGWTVEIMRRQARDKGSPAHAGMDHIRCWPLLAEPWLPRARGDGPPPLPAHPVPAGAPPRTRGWTPESLRFTTRCRGSPAHAGMDLVDAADFIDDPWLPRARGDGPPSLF